MNTLHAIWIYVVAHWGMISSVVTLLMISMINHNIGNPAFQNWLQIILDVLSVKSNAGQGVRFIGSDASTKMTGGLMLPLIMRSAKPASTSPTPPADTAGPIGLTILIPFLIFSQMSCNGYCQLAEHQDEARCKLAGGLIDCSAKEIVEALGSLLPVVLAAISGNEIDWVALGRLEAANGVAVIACAISKLDFMSQTPEPMGFQLSPHGRETFSIQHVHNHAQQYMVKRAVKVKQ